MTRILALAAALLLVAVPVMGQTTPETPKPGTIVVVAGVWDGMAVVPVPGSIIVPPLACDPA